MMRNGMRPMHPGKILLDEFMKPSAPAMNANTLAKALDVPANRITGIIKGQRGITGDTAVRLATCFKTTAEFWMNLQKTYELRLAEQALSSKVRKAVEETGSRLYRPKSMKRERYRTASLNVTIGFSFKTGLQQSVLAPGHAC